jgi:hypothetical protein
MRSRWWAGRLAVALLTVGAACGSGAPPPSGVDAVCQHYLVLEERDGMLLAADGSDLAGCTKTQERSRRKLGDAAYAPYAACLLAANNMVEWMSCDPRHPRTPDPVAP